MIRVGLTGGIGAGKSAAAQRFAALGAEVIDYDVLARRAVDPGTPGLRRVVAEFGPGIAPGGQLDRGALARVVFHDPAALERLNAIVHPEVARLAQDAEAAAVAQNSRLVVVHDIPLLVENGDLTRFAHIVVVMAPTLLRVQRLLERGMDAGQARARMAAQADDDARLAVADVVLDGSGTVEHLQAQIDAVWPKITRTA